MAAALAACQNKDNAPARDLLLTIEHLYDEERYGEALDSITELRRKYPQATEERRRALEIWQEASLKITQQDIARTDSMLSVANAELALAEDIRTRNKLTARRDSLDIQYETLCLKAKAIKGRMEQLNTKNE